MKKKILVIVTALIMAMTMTGAASALTSWQSFGGITFYSRGTSGYTGFSPLSLLSSTTKVNPQQIQLKVVGGSTARKVDIDWTLWCDGPKGLVYRTNGSGISVSISSTKPYVKTWTRSNSPWINRGVGTYCELEVWLSHTNYSNTDGVIKASLLARY